MLSRFPVAWTAPEVRQTLALLTDAVYREADIVAVVQDAGLPVGQVAFDARSSLTWRSVFEVAAGQGRVEELLDAVAAVRPGLGSRLAELRDAEPVVATELSTPDQPILPWKNFSADGQAEAVIVAGQPTFVDVAFLSVGVERSRSVCRLRTRFPSGRGSGTAFRVGAQHLLTNHHVLFDGDQGTRTTAVEAWFNYEDDTAGDPKPVTRLRCDPASIVGEPHDDWAVVRTEDEIPDDFPVLDLVPTRVPQVDDRVYIIQHPGGGPKQVAFQHNLVRAVTPEVLQYWTDTDLGSSGSPVFDESWQLVALHHFSLKVAQDRMGLRNQGRRIDRVVERMRDCNALPELQP